MSADDAIDVRDLKSWYRLVDLERIGEGGFGVVYRAFDPLLERTVALKLLKARWQPTGSDPSVPAIIAEGRRLAKVSHPNVIGVLGAEVDAGHPGLWMEFIDGQSLEQWIDTHGRLGEAETIAIAVDVCKALCALHAHDIVHRDINARNVMRDSRRGCFVLMDLGASVDRGQAFAPGQEIVGTFRYMAPEMLRGEDASPRSDIYAVGVLMFYMLTKDFPIRDVAPSGRPREARRLRQFRTDISSRLVGIVERALSAEPENRFATAADLEAVLLDKGATTVVLPAAPAPAPAPSTRRRRRWWRPAAALAVLAVGWLVWKYVLDDGPEIRATLTRYPNATPLRDGDAVALGDNLLLDVSCSDSLYVYVVNRDDADRAFLLFPHPQYALGNPLPPGEHWLPGRLRTGKLFGWRVSQPARTETYWVIASRVRPLDLEAQLFQLESPQVTADGDVTFSTTRGTGELFALDESKFAEPLLRILNGARTLGNGSEEVVGTWTRRVQLRSAGSKP